MRVMSFISEDLEQYTFPKFRTLLQELEKADLTKPMMSVPFGLSKEFAAIRLAENAIHKTLMYYDTEIEEDVEILRKQYEKEISITYPQYAATVLRYNEKRILHHTLYQLEEYTYHLEGATAQDIIL